MGYKPLPPGVAKKLIEGHTDVLTPLANARTYRITESQCPRCHGAMTQKLHATFAFTQDDPLPRTVAVCKDCGYTVDPVTNLVLDVGRPGQVKEALHTVGQSD